MGLRTIFKAAGHWLKGTIVKVDSEIQFDATSNPEIDSTGGDFIWKTKTTSSSSWKINDPVATEDILLVDTLAKEITLHPNYKAFGFNGSTHVHVYDASDLPAALVTNTTYIIHGTITTANTILVANQNTAIVGLNRDSDRLIYTGNTTFIDILDADFFINNICFEATDPASLVIDARNYTAASFNEGRNKILHITNCQFRNCYNVCDFEGFDLVDIENTLFWYIKAPTIGLRYLNTSKIEITSCEFIRWFDETTIPTPGGWSTAAMFEIQPNGAGVGIGAVNITSSLFHPQQTQDAIKIDNTSTTGFGTISANTFVTAGLTTGVIGNFDYDIQNSYIIQSNQGLSNGNAKGTLLLTGNSVYLDNSTTNPIIIKGSNTVGGVGFTNPILFPISTRVLTSVADGSFTYNSKIDGNFFVAVSATVQQAGNGVITIRARQNGVAIPAPVGVTEIRTGIADTLNFSILGFTTIGDVFDFEVESSSSSDVLISELVINGYQF